VAFDSTPRIAFLSPLPESGKTRALEATEPLVYRPITTVNASSNYLFRKAGDDAGPPTVLFDEIDTIFGPKAKDHDDIRGFINAGHRKGASYGRCRAVGNTVITEDSPCYAAVAMAGLGWLPDTLLSRAAVIRMQRRLKGEKVESFRTRTSIPEGKAIGAQLAAWAKSVFDAAVAARPVLPEGVEDRQADAWEGLLVVADLAGGEWPALAREAAVALVKVNRDTPATLRLRLLQDLRLVFWKNLTAAAQARPKGLPTETVLNELYCLEDAPWATINKGEQYTSSELASRLFDYGVEPIQLRPYVNTDTQKRGYPLGPLAVAWRRYLKPLVLPYRIVTGVTASQREALDMFFDWIAVDDDGNPVTDVTGDMTSMGNSCDRVTPVTVQQGPSARGGAAFDSPYAYYNEFFRKAAEKAAEGHAGKPTAPPELPERLDAERIKGLVGWWRAQIKQRQKELSPALAKDQVRKLLREVLAEQIRESALDTEINRIAKAAAPKKAAAKKPATKRRSQR
jgi:hypothetical protein